MVDGRLRRKWLMKIMFEVGEDEEEESIRFQGTRIWFQPRQEQEREAVFGSHCLVFDSTHMKKEN